NLATAALRGGVSTTAISPASGGFVGLLRTHKLATVVAVVLLAVVAAAGYYVFTAGESLAVLPFTYDAVGPDPQLMADPDREYLTDGITDSIINNLAQLPNLKVIARSSVFRYKGREIDAQTIGRELGVRTVLTGRIKQRGGTLTISPELLAVSDYRHI